MSEEALKLRVVEADENNSHTETRTIYRLYSRREGVEPTLFTEFQAEDPAVAEQEVIDIVNDIRTQDTCTHVSVVRVDVNHKYTTIYEYDADKS